MSRYFEFKDEKSNKFWEISQNSSKMIVRYGKIGVLGQTLTKEFSSPKEATIQVEKSIAKKLKEGYLEVETQKIESSWPFGNTSEDDKSTVTKIIEKKLTKDEVVKGNKILLMFPMRELHVMEIEESEYKKYIENGISNEEWDEDIHPRLSNHQSFYSATYYDDSDCELWINDNFVADFNEKFKKLYLKEGKGIKNPIKPNYYALAYPTSYKSGDFILNISEEFDFGKLKLNLEKVFTYEGRDDFITILDFNYGDERFEYGDTEDPFGDEVFLFNPTTSEIKRISVDSGYDDEEDED